MLMNSKSFVVADSVIKLLGRPDYKINMSRKLPQTDNEGMILVLAKVKKLVKSKPLQIFVTNSNNISSNASFCFVIKFSTTHFNEDSQAFLHRSH